MTATADRRGDQLIARRWLAFPPQTVWSALTTAADVAMFWGGTHVRIPPESVVIDLRPGGEFAMQTLGPDGPGRYLRFVYVAIDQPSRLMFDEPTSGLRTTIMLHATGSGTLLRIHQRRLPVDLQTEQAARGLAAMIDCLADHLDTRTRNTRRPR